MATTGALEAFERSLQGYTALGRRDEAAQVLNNIGLAYTDLGEPDRAQQAYTEASRAFGEEHDHTNELNVALNQVQLCIATGRFDEARDRAEPLLARSGEVAPSWRGEIFRHAGVIAREAWDYVKAAEYLGRAGECAEEAEDLLLKADVAEQLAELYWTQKRHRDMLLHLNKSHALYSRLKAHHRVEQVERRNAALGFPEMAHYWGDSIESKDHYTQGHCERVAFFACVLADTAGMDSRLLFRSQARRPAPRHWQDHRSDRSTQQGGEAVVRGVGDNEAPPRGEFSLSLVSDIDFPGDVRAIIRNHHERWDGTGYPDGLAGEEIPFAARILCVADVYDALTTARSYRDSMSHTRAAHLMRASKGQFDPRLLEMFLDWATTEDIPARTPEQRVAAFTTGLTA